MTVLRVDTIAASGQTSENTGSVFFDGTGDYIFHGGSDIIWNTNASDACTFECWLYVTDLSSARQIFHLGDEGDFSIQTDGQIRVHVLSSNWKDTNQSITTNTWYHIALVQETGRKDVYINGVKSTYTIGSGDPDGSNWDTQAATNGNYFYIGDDGVYRDYFQGYISNLRVVRNIALYNENFTPPTRELEVTPETVLLCCYDGENIFAEKTGKIIAAYGDRLSSPTPTATDSPIGITTFQPGLTRGVDVTAGPTLDGDLEFNSQNFFVLPKGTTTDRNQTGGRGLFGGGYISSGLNTIEYVTISSTGNAQDFGDLTDGRFKVASLASSTRGLFAGGWDGLPNFNIIDYVTIATTSNAVDFGDLTAEKRNSSGLSNSTRGIIAGGDTPTTTNIIDYVTIASLGDATTFGELITSGQSLSGGVSSPTRGVFGGGAPGITTLQYITIATTGNAQNFGDLTVSKQVGNACSSATRGIFGGAQDNTIDYITISSLGNAQDFGDMFVDRALYGATSNSIKGIFGGGRKTPTNYNTIDYITIASTGDAQDFGDLTQVKYYVDATSDSHGGL